MFGKRVKLFSLFGFRVSIDLSWIIIAVLVTWSLAEGVFPRYLAGLHTATYWWMGLVGAAGLLGVITLKDLLGFLTVKMDLSG